MMKIIFVSFIVLGITACSTVNHSGKASNQQAKDSLANEINAILQQGNFNGLSVAIVNEKGTLYSNGFGYADVVLKKKYTAQTIQNIGSISKTLVGIAMAKAQELGKLKLDDPINNYLPFKVVNPYFPNESITIRQLATHTSTITDNIFYLKRNYILKPDQDLKNVKLFLEDEQVINPYDSILSLQTYLQNVLTPEGKWYAKEDFLERKPGEQFEYSNVATALAAYVVERATGVPFKTFTQQYILQPLNMRASGWDFEAVHFEDYSRLYQTPDTLLPYYSLITYPDGNFITSANDLAKFCTELIRGYSGHGRLLSKESYQAYFKEELSATHFLKRNEKNPYSDEYNVGLFIGYSVAGNIGHTGGDPGVSTIMFFDPKKKIGRLLIINTNINDKQGNAAFYDIWNRLEKYEGRF